LKKLAILIVICVVFSGSYFGSKWWISDNTKQQFDNTLTNLTQELGFPLSNTSYTSGFENSQAKSVINIGQSKHVLSMPLDLQEKFKDANINLLHTITHGPVVSTPTQSFVPALAYIKTEIEFDESLDKDIKKIFQGETPLLIHTLVDISGNADNELIVSPITFQENNTFISWSGAKGSFNWNSEKKSLVMNVSSPQLSIKDNEADAKIDSINLRGEMNKISDNLWLGNSEFGFKTASFSELENGEIKGKVAIDNIFLKMRQDLEDQLVNSLNKFSIDKVQVDDQNYGPVVLLMDINNLDVNSLEEMQVISNSINNQANMSQEKLAAAWSSILTQLLPGFLQKGPEIKINEFSVNTPQGMQKARFQISLKIEEGEKIDLENIVVILEKIKAELDVDLTESMVLKVAELQLKPMIMQQINTQGAQMSDAQITQQSHLMARQQINMLVEQKMVEMKNGILSSKARLSDMTLTINGNPANELMEMLLSGLDDG